MASFGHGFRHPPLSWLCCTLVAEVSSHIWLLGSDKNAFPGQTDRLCRNLCRNLGIPWHSAQGRDLFLHRQSSPVCAMSNTRASCECWGHRTHPRGVPGRVCPTQLPCPGPSTLSPALPASSSGPGKCRVSPKAGFNHSVYFWKLSGILCPAEPCVLFPANSFSSSSSSSHLLALPSSATCNL